jgi:hypothetical protein
VLSSCHGGCEGAVELAGDVALEASADLADGLAFGGPAGDVVAGPVAAAHAGEGNVVDRPVQGAVTAAVEAVPDGTGRCWLLARLRLQLRLPPAYASTCGQEPGGVSSPAGRRAALAPLRRLPGAGAPVLLGRHPLTNHGDKDPLLLVSRCVIT